MHHFLDSDDLAGINRVWLHNDLKVLDLHTMPGWLSRLSTRLLK